MKSGQSVLTQASYTSHNRVQLPMTRWCRLDEIMQRSVRILIKILYNQFNDF